MRTRCRRVADRRWRRTVALLMLCSASSARAQSTPTALAILASHPAVDSATVARRAVRDAQRDARSDARGDANGAPAPTPAQQVALLQRATRAWPTQPAYWQLLVRVATMADDTATLAEATRALERLDAGATPVNPIAVHDVVTLTDSTAFVEGLVRDQAPRTLLVTEMRRGTVLRVDAAGRTTDLHLDTIAGMSAVWAVRPLPNDVDLLLVTASTPPHQRSRAMTSPMPAALWRIDAHSGAVRDRWPLPDSLAAHAPGELVVMADGTVIISDAATATLYAHAPGQAAWVSIRHALLRSPQGMVEITPGVLIVADYTHGLLRVEPTSGSVTRLHDATRGTVLGLDGLALHHGWIFGVQNGLATPRIVAIRLDERATQVQQVRTLWRDPARLLSPTAIAADDDGLWLFTNTQWDDYDDEGARRAARPLRAASIVRLPWGHADVNSAVPPARTTGRSSTASVPPVGDRSTVNRPRDP